MALSAFLTLAYSHSDKLLSTGILSERVTGYLTAAFVINFGVIELLSVSVLVAAYPLLSRYYGEGRNPLFGFMIEKLTLYMFLLAIPMALSISILADKIMVPLLGDAYAPSAGILRLLIWYTGITIVGNVINRGLLIQNRQRLLLLIRGSSLALNITLTAILLLNWRDPRGAVIASVVGEILVLVVMLMSFRAVGWQPRRIAHGAFRAAVAAVPAALVMLGAARAVYRAAAARRARRLWLRRRLGARLEFRRLGPDLPPGVDDAGRGLDGAILEARCGLELVTACIFCI